MPTYAYRCDRCGFSGDKVAAIGARDEQVCKCGEKLVRVFACPSPGQIRIPVYMMAATEDNFPKSALEPQTEAERRIHAEARAERPYGRWV